MSDHSQKHLHCRYYGRHHRYHQNHYHYRMPSQHQNFEHLNNHSPYHFHHHHNLHRHYHCQDRLKPEQRLHENLSPPQIDNDERGETKIRHYLREGKFHSNNERSKPLNHDAFNHVFNFISIYRITCLLFMLKQCVLYSGANISFRKIVCIIVLMILSVSRVSSASSSESSSSSPSSKLCITVVVAQSCDETFLSSLTSKVNTAIHDAQKNEKQTNVDSFQITFSVFPECNRASVLLQLNDIFSNESTDVILALASYDIHASFIPLAQIYQKAYIVGNNHMASQHFTPSFAPFPSFAQESQMLAKILDMYKWQNVYVMYTDFRYWVDFSNTLYFILTTQSFLVRTTKIDTSTPEERARVLKDVGIAKAIVLLMDISDQQEVLASASTLSMTTKHAIFSFSDSPYDVTSRSLIGLQSDDTSHSKFSDDITKPDVSIFESVFVIASSFPKTEQDSNNDSNDGVRLRRKRRAEHPLTFRSEQEVASKGVQIPIDIQTTAGATNDLNFRQRNISQKPDYENSRNTNDNIPKLYKNGDLMNNRNYKSVIEKGENDDILSYGNNKNETSNVETSKSFNSLGKQHILQEIKTGEKIRQNTSVTTMPTETSSFEYVKGRSKLRNETSTWSKFVFNITKKTGTNHSRSNFVAHHPSFSPKANDRIMSSSNLGSLYSDLTKAENLHEAKRSGVSRKSSVGNSLLFQSESKWSSEFVFGANHEDQLQFDATEIESRSKRDVHNFKTVDADLDAAYDVIYLLSFVAYENHRDKRQALTSGTLISHLANVSFRGASGTFDVGTDLEVKFDFALFDYNVTSGKFESRVHLEATSPSDWLVVGNQPINWPGGRVLLSDICFKQNSDCDEGFQAAYIVAIVIATIALIFIVIFIVSFIRRYWVNKEMAKGPNKILMQASDLVFIYKKDVGKSSRTMMKSRATLTDKENTPDIIRASDPTSRSMPSLNDLTDFTQTARYNGDLVHVKEMDIKGFEMKSKLHTYIRMLRDLRHENLNPLVGFLVDENKPSMVMEYCSRGSLHDMIHNDDIKLDWDFKLSLLTDLVRGIRYLHSCPLKFHGHLNSHNCVIDSRFVLKVTTYGSAGIMERCKASRVMEPKDCLWSAPELLRDPALMQKGTDKGDLYSMAIVFQEITLRSEPYSTTGLTPEEIIRKLKKPPPLIRPSVTPQAAPPQFIQIMKQCWSELPEMRPSMDEVYDQFKKMTGGKKANIVDTMFKMLEKYSNDLEDIVAERTMQLEEEKKKTDQLLFRMLPPTVAESLKMGQTVEAETFSDVSIYFSDIVGFTTISAMSTPMQVVDLLNDLYTMFDATIDNYDVYKVETIGDAYMVASGLPIKNGNRHAGEISTMALMLLSQCGEFTIRHMPHVPLRLRIGLHTGSCVAGVVGLTMPRFCLFGDTVNTASRMESTGAAFRIHISEACKNILDDLGGYKVVFRGKTELKGKGKLNTYWLVGKEGLDKDLPEPPPLVGNDAHGLESILRHMESDPLSTTPKPIGHVSPTKSCSAPELVTPSTSPLPSNNLLLPVSDGHTSSSASQPSNLDSLQTLHKETCKHSDQKRVSVVHVDIHRLGCGQNIVGGVDRSPADEGLEVDGERMVSENNDANLVGVETGKDEYNNRHSESNDSGFGAERKHSQGQEFNSGFQTSNDKAKRNSSNYSTMTSNRASVVSSSDVSLNHHLTLTSDGHEETLAPVSEV